MCAMTDPNYAMMHTGILYQHRLLSIDHYPLRRNRFDMRLNTRPTGTTVPTGHITALHYLNPSSSTYIHARFHDRVSSTWRFSDQSKVHNFILPRLCCVCALDVHHQVATFSMWQTGRKRMTFDDSTVPWWEQISKMCYEYEWRRSHGTADDIAGRHLVITSCLASSCSGKLTRFTFDHEEFLKFER